jgi:hypothetical protein
MAKINGPSLELVASEGADLRIVSVLSAHLNIAPGKYMFLRASADTGDLPQFIQLVGEAAAWLPLSIFAAAYLKRIAEKAADTTWDAIKRKLNRSNKDEAAFVESVSSLIDARSKLGERSALIIGLNYPESYWGTVVVIKEREEEEIARKIAMFVLNADKISELIHKEVDAGAKPLGYVYIEFPSAGHIKLHWVDNTGFVLEERHFRDPKAY